MDRREIGWLGGCGMNSVGSGQGPVAGCFVSAVMNLRVLAPRS
jgi:hypothetical protein